MKCIGMNAYFKLPEDFEGSLPDAIRLLADYLDDESKPFQEPGFEHNEITREANKFIFKEFFDSKAGFVGFADLSKLSKDGKTMEQMDLKLKGK